MRCSYYYWLGSEVQSGKGGAGQSCMFSSESVRRFDTVEVWVRVLTGLPSFSITQQKAIETFSCNSSPVNWPDLAASKREAREAQPRRAAPRCKAAGMHRLPKGECHAPASAQSCSWLLLVL